MTDDPAAVFGLSDTTEGPPEWVADDAAVARRINAKRYDDIGPEVWWQVAELARLCRVLGRHTDRRQVPVEPLRDALRLALQVAPALPIAPPPRLARPSPLAAPPEELLVVGPRAHLVDAAAAPLARALDDLLWTDPVVLAGLVDDLLSALACYAADVLALAGEPLPVATAIAERTPRR